MSDEVSSEGEDDKEPPLESGPGTRILWAAQHNCLDLVSQLLTLPDLVHYHDEDGYTALHRASYSNHPEVVLKLLEFGADVGARTTEDEWTPLHSAARWNAAECVELLLSWGANINAKTKGGQTPLHLAAFCKGSKATLLLLLMHDDLQTPSVNCQQDTPKDIAKRNGNCVELFKLAEPQFRVDFLEGGEVSGDKK